MKPWITGFICKALTQKDLVRSRVYSSCNKINSRGHRLYFRVVNQNCDRVMGEQSANDTTNSIEERGKTKTGLM